MKIALITDDGKTISQHFGRAPYYLVVTIDEGKVITREMREKMGHNQFSDHGHEEGHGEHHGINGESHGKHAMMADTISDCQVVICGGMGMGAYESMRRLNIQPVVTDMSDIDKVIQAYIDGTLEDHTERLH
jgi:predicted Fe-Mo cluster-binding NifX family protein